VAGALAFVDWANAIVYRDIAGERPIPSMRTSGRQVYADHLGWSASLFRVLKVYLGQCGCCTFLLHRRVELDA
jgi:hypothetical protein